MTLTKPYEATFQVGDGETKDFPFYFDEVSENFIRVIIKRADGSIYYPIFSVDMELLRVVFGEDEITPTADDVICIYRDTPAIQDTQFNTLQGYNAKALENILSKIVAMIQEMKANGFSTQILQGEPWSLDLIKPADDGASVQIDYQARVLKKGLYFKMSDGNLLASADGVNFVQMPKSENVAEFRQRADDKGNIYFEYRVGSKWFGLATSADIADTYTKTEIDNKFKVANAQIDANADAIQKTRDDMNAEDGRLQTQITAHAGAITALQNEQTATGNQIQTIESKIPDGTSETNPLINKQQLLDEEMDIRDDLNEMASELQTQITAQAAEIATKQDQLTAGDNIIISGNIISATGAGGGAGFDIVVVQELPATGQKGIIYLLAKDGTAPDVYDEYVWITATQTFELIGTTQVDLTGYVKNTDYATETTGGVIKTARTSFGVAVDGSGFLYASVKTKEQYAAALTNMFIAKGTLENIKYDIVKQGVTASTIELTDDEKTAARSWISAVGNTDYATSDTGGVIKVATSRGLTMSGGYLYALTKTLDNYTTSADNTFIGKGTLENIKYDLVKRGITENDIALTDEEKAAAQAWLGVSGGGTKVIIKRYN